jgi:ABC-type Fe3+-hydroxamate transport system substrate-binding protein
MKNKSLTKHILSLLFILALISLSGCGGGSSSAQEEQKNTNIYTKDASFAIKHGQKIVILEQDTTYTSSTNASTNETTITVTRGKLKVTK